MPTLDVNYGVGYALKIGLAGKKTIKDCMDLELSLVDIYDVLKDMAICEYYYPFSEEALKKRTLSFLLNCPLLSLTSDYYNPKIRFALEFESVKDYSEAIDAIIRSGKCHYSVYDSICYMPKKSPKLNVEDFVKKGKNSRKQDWEYERARELHAEFRNILSRRGNPSYYTLSQCCGQPAYTYDYESLMRDEPHDDYLDVIYRDL